MATNHAPEPKRAFKGVWIPAEIWLNTELTWMEKCLYAEINSLDDPDDGCTASNEYLANIFNTSAASIANSISKLRSGAYLTTASFNGRVRVLRVNPALTPRLRQPKPVGYSTINPQVKAEPSAILKVQRKGKKGEEECAGAPAISPTRQFTDGWGVRYKKRTGVDYNFYGGKDGKAVATLLKFGTPEHLLAILDAAHKQTDSRRFWNCVNQTSEIAQFAAALNKINGELALATNGNGHKEQWELAGFSSRFAYETCQGAV